MQEIKEHRDQREPPLNSLKFLSGGAANGLVNQLKPAFKTASNLVLDGDFGAVGGMVDRIKSGEAVDLVILTTDSIAELAASGHILHDSIRDVGLVSTGLAVNIGQPISGAIDEAGLRDTLVAAAALYFPDSKKSTAGRHVASVLAALGLADVMKDRLREFPNGMTAMARMVDDALPGALGCTQVTEIVATPGVQYVGDLPGEYSLTTMYVAAVTTAATRPVESAAFIRLLTDPETASIRQEVGFS